MYGINELQWLLRELGASEEACTGLHVWHQRSKWSFRALVQARRHAPAWVQVHARTLAPAWGRRPRGRLYRPGAFLKLPLQTAVAHCKPDVDILLPDYFNKKILF